MAKVGKKKRKPAVATAALKHVGAKENVKVKLKEQAKENANDFGKGKAFDKAQGIAPDNTPASGNFDVVLGLIQAARARAVTAVNTTLIELYWCIGQYISRKAAKDGWGTGTVAELSRTIQRKYQGMTGYSASNLWRMTQFYEMYCEQPKLAPLVRVLSWTHNLIILSRCKGKEEREFYLRLTVREKWVKRDLERQITGALFERTVLAPPKMSAALAGAISNQFARQAIASRQTK